MEKKKFVESFARYGELERDGFLLPNGETKRLLTDATQTKALPPSAPSFEELHRRGLAYSESLRTSGCQGSEMKPARNAVKCEIRTRPATLSMDEQKAILRAKGFNLDGPQVSDLEGQAR